VRIAAFILRCRKISAQWCQPAFDMADNCQRDVAAGPGKIEPDDRLSESRSWRGYAGANAWKRSRTPERHRICAQPFNYLIEAWEGERQRAAA